MAANAQQLDKFDEQNTQIVSVPVISVLNKRLSPTKFSVISKISIESYTNKIHHGRV